MHTFLRSPLFAALFSSILGAFLGTVSDYTLGKAIERQGPPLDASVGEVELPPKRTIPAPVDTSIPSNVADSDEPSAGFEQTADGEVLANVPIASGSHEGKLTVHVLAREYRWLFGDPLTVLHAGEGLEHQRVIDMVRFLESAGLQRRLGEAEAIVAVGTASCEGDRAVEELRAGERADNLISWVRQAAPRTDSRFYFLNLGQFKDGGGCPDDKRLATGDQRRVILLYISQKDPSLDAVDKLQEALREAFMKHEALSKRFHPSRYSRFELELAT